MVRLQIEKAEGTVIATVAPEGKATYKIDTEDSRIRAIIEEVLARAGERGLVQHADVSQHTESGMRHQRRGRKVKPGATGFLQALGDYLVHYDLLAYPIESDDPTDRR